MIFYFEPYNEKAELVGSIARLDDNIDYMRFKCEDEGVSPWREIQQNLD